MMEWAFGILLAGQLLVFGTFPTKYACESFRQEVISHAIHSSTGYIEIYACEETGRWVSQ